MSKKNRNRRLGGPRSKKRLKAPVWRTNVGDPMAHGSSNAADKKKAA